MLRRLTAALAAAVVLSACDGTDEHRQPLASAAFCGDLDSDAGLILIGGPPGHSGLWTLDGSRRFQWNTGTTPPTACTLSPDGRTALTASSDGIALWNAVGGESLGFWAMPAPVQAVALADAGIAVAALANGEAWLFDSRRGELLRRLGHDSAVFAVAVTPDGTRAVTGSDDGLARLWDLESGETLQRWAHEAPVVTVALSGDGTRVFTSARYTQATVWNGKSGDAIWQLPVPEATVRRGHYYTSARFSEEDDLLLTGTGSGRISLWDVARRTPTGSWQLTTEEPLPPSATPVIALDADGGRIYALSSNGSSYRLER